MVDNMGNNLEREGFKNHFASASTSLGEDGVIKEQDWLPPIANVGWIMKQMLPPNAKISKEAKETTQECVSEFIRFVIGEASDKCHKEKCNTVNGDDICWALATQGFDDYAESLRTYLQRYRELEGERAQQSKGSNNEEKNETSDYGVETPRKAAVPTTPLRFNVIDRSNSTLSRQF